MSNNQRSTKKGNSFKNSNGNSAKSKNSGNKSRSVGNNNRANNNGQRSPNIGRERSMTIVQPRQSMLKNGNLLIKHREFIQKVPGSVNFSVTSIPINPGLPAQFNWLWMIAHQYESYRFRKLSYEFVNSKTGTFAGEVILGIDYDPDDSAPINEQMLQSYWGSRSGCITSPLTLHANMQAANKIPTKLCRLGLLNDSTTSFVNYDVGDFFVATTDCADTSNIGRLFVDYEVELMTPQTQLQQLSGITNFTGETATDPLGTGVDTSYGTFTGVLNVVWLSSTTFSVPVAGRFYYKISQIGTGMTAAAVLTAASPSSASPATNYADVGALKSCSEGSITVINTTDIFTLGLGTVATVTSTLIQLSAR